MAATKRLQMVSVLSGILFLLANGAIAFLTAGKQHPWIFAGCCVVAFGAMFLQRGAAQHENQFGLALVFAVAVGARLIAFATPPLLSGDLHRYLWDGKLFSSGISPYDYKPLDSALISLRDEHYEKMNSRFWYSVYPPLAQVFFATAWKISASVGAWKALALTLDLCSILILWRLIHNLKFPSSNLVYYAWNPLVIWEAVGNGHTEVLMIPFVLLTLLCWRRNSLSGFAWGLATLAKLPPALGLFWMFKKSRATGLLAALTCLAGGLAFFRPGNVMHFLDSLKRYYSLFAFNSPLYRMAVNSTRSLDFHWEHKVGVGMFVVFVVTFSWLVWKSLVGRHPSGKKGFGFRVSGFGFGPLFNQKREIRTGKPVSVPSPCTDDERLEFVAFLQTAFTLYLVLSPVIHPWYFLLLAWTLPVAPRPSLLWLNAALPFSYVAYQYSPPQDLPLILSLEFVPFALLWLLERAEGNLQNL